MKRFNKYNAERTFYKDRWYDSIAEARYARLLNMLRLAARIEDRIIDIKYQKNFDLGNKINYRADFFITYADGHSEVHEVKGFETRDWKLKLKLFKSKYPETIIKIIKLEHGKFKIKQFEGKQK